MEKGNLVLLINTERVYNRNTDKNDRLREVKGKKGYDESKQR